MVLLQSFLISLLALPLVSANPLFERKLDCSKPKPQVKSFTKTAKSVAGTQISSFCSSYLKYKTKTKTVVETYTYTDVVDEFTTDGTVTYLTYATTYESATETVSRTIAVYDGVKKRDAAATPTITLNPTAAPAQITDAPAYDDAEWEEGEDEGEDEDEGDEQEELDLLGIHGRAIPKKKKLKADSRGCVLGFKPKIVREACRCLVKKPKPTTETSYFAILKTTTVTYTIPSAVAWTTTTETLHSYSYISSISTVTYRKPTNCGTQAQPTFFVQMRDVNRTSTDQWDNTYIGVSDGNDWTYIVGEVSKSHAVLVTVEPGTNYLREVQNGRYLNTDSFNDFQLVHFNTKSYIEERGYHHIACSIAKVGNERELKCNAPTAVWGFHIWQTCRYTGNILRRHLF
ncbi:hypothetical protein EDB81DRAFT_778481 [Dactylonectria macrodidyma]|uniref:Uncharacterized protein n=1 Tax=Dactylonectria macrodidyma TaxID=307937 RepID=A0A9P9FS86_9HYPO|nr:hypothetical protein EDB81DRAFT_778481 [Dactylonectria macrodidyma]